MKRAFLVLGPESSGTRWLTQAQRWDTQWPTDEPLIVWRRSFPHAEAWPNIPQKVRRLRALGYDVQALVTCRDWFAMEQSQCGFHASLDEVRANMQEVYSLIFAVIAIARLPYLVVSYEAIGQRPNEFMARVYRWLNLPVVPVDWRNGNDKWYEEEHCG